MKRLARTLLDVVLATVVELPPTVTALRSVVQELARTAAPGGPLDELLRATAALAWAKAATLRDPARTSRPT